MSDSDYIRYDEIFDESLKQQLELYYKDSYRNGWGISEVVKLKDGKWLIKWVKYLMPKVKDL